MLKGLLLSHSNEHRITEPAQRTATFLPIVPHANPRLKVIVLYTVVVVLIVLWLLGLVTHVAGSLIHLLLVVALIVLIFNFISGRRGAMQL